MSDAQAEWRIMRALMIGEALGYRRVLRNEPTHLVARLMLRNCLAAAARRRGYEKEAQRHAERRSQQAA